MAKKKVGRRMYTDVYAPEGTFVNGIKASKWELMSNKEREAVRKRRRASRRIW